MGKRFVPFHVIQRARVKGRAAPAADAYICSFPKTGRTWLRFQLARYVTDVCGLDADVDLDELFELLPNDEPGGDKGLRAFRFAGRAPLIASSHAPHQPRYDGAPTVWISRGVLDVLVSYYLHRARQAEATVTTDLVTFALGDGGDELAGYVNGWAPHLRSKLVVTYEQMTDHGEETLAQVVTYLGLPLRADAVRNAVEASSFRAMAESEAARPVRGRRYDYGDRDARRVRKGEVGGWREHLTDDDGERVLRRLDRALTPDARELLASLGSLR